MKTSTKYLGTLALAATLTVASLTGCITQAPDAAPKPTHSSTAVATPKPTIAALTPGAVVTANTALPEGQLAYKLADGSLVVVDEAQPLPTSVESEIHSEVQKLQVKLSSTTSSDALGGILQSLANVRMQEGAATGKRIVTVFHPNNNAPLPGSYWSFWPMPAGMDLSAQGSWTRADAVGFAQSYVDGQDNPETFSVIVSG